MDEPRIELTSAETPRREAVRAMGAAGAALLGALGMSAAADAKGKHKVKADKKGKRGKRGKRGASGSNVSVVLGTTDSFDVDEDAATAANSDCPAGGIAISANIGITNPNCNLNGSAQSGNGTWQVAVVCPSGHSSNDNSAQAICLVIT